MSASRDSVDNIPGQNNSLESPLPHADSRVTMNQLSQRILPGAVVHFELRDGSSRRLSVESEGVPEWGSQILSEEHEVGKVLSGYGTTYLLVGNITETSKYSPILTWPSKYPSSEFVAAITVEEPAEEQIVSDTTAADLLWRVERYGGR